MTAFVPTRPSGNRLRDFALVSLLLIVALQSGLPALRALAQDGGGGGSRAVVSNEFTYQGRLIQDGIPANGSFDFEFALFDVDSGGSPLATLAVIEDVLVTNGTFSARLDFAVNHFAGDARWLEVHARPGASTGSFALLGRQELTATPYALYATSALSATVATELVLPFSATVTNSSNEALLSLTHTSFGDTSVATLGNRFNAVYGEGAYNGVFGMGATGVGGSGTTIGVAGSTSNPLGKGVEGMNFGGGWGVYGDGLTGVYGRAAEPTGKGVHGDGNLFGVFGESPNTAVKGQHTGDSANGIGVFGVSSRGYGVYGSAPTSGIAATATGVYGQGGRIGVEGAGLGNGSGVVGGTSSVLAYGVNGSNGGSGVGVRGYSTGGTTGIGVFGQGQGDGVRGETTTLDKAGVSGIAAGGANTNWAAYFVGNVNVDGTVTATVMGPSDARLKHNITPLTSGLAAILQLRPVHFAWLDGHDANRAHPGFIAQEVREVLPEVVYEQSNEMGTLALNSAELIPILVAAIQELEARLAALEAAAE